MNEGVMMLVWMVGIAVIAILSRRAALDMDSRGQPGWIYGVLVLFSFPIGLLVWLMARERDPRAASTRRTGATLGERPT